MQRGVYYVGSPMAITLVPPGLPKFVSELLQAHHKLRKQGPAIPRIRAVHR